MVLKKKQPEVDAPVGAGKNASEKKMDKTAEMSKLMALEAKNAELMHDLQRTRADFENFRKQADAQRERAGQLATEATVAKLLPLLDDMDRALTAHPVELGPLTKNFEKTYQGLGLAKINSEPGTEFNPDYHDAVMVEGDGDQEVIGETLRSGYLYGDQVLRPAMVKVIKQ